MFLILLACAPQPTTGMGQVWQDLDAAAQGDFYAAPWPHLDRFHGGTADLSAFPNPDGVTFVDQLLELSDGRLEGAGTTSGIYFRLRVPLAQEGLLESGAVQLVDVDPASPELARRIPLSLRYQDDAGPFGDAQLLALLPLQGVPMRPGTLYAAVLTTELGLDPWPGFSELLHGSDDLALAAAATVALVAPPDQVAGFTAFRTQDPTAELARWVAAARVEHPPALPDDLALVEVFDDFCVYEGSTTMPAFQRGEPPYLTEGGDIVQDDKGQPVLDHYETARVVLSLARDGGAEQPVVVFVRTGGGGDRPLVDRGVRGSDGVALEPGSGLARDFAQVGWAGISVDGPLGGLRNTTGGDEQFLIFNVSNPAAMRGNIRQSALELALLPDLLAELRVDARDCPGLEDTVSFDLGSLALFGHSMGATIGPLAVGAAPEYRALLLSGAGGSWIENIVHKQLPLEVRPIAEQMLGYDSGQLHEHDPVLSLLQHAGESADPPVWGRTLQDRGVEVLMLQGIVDHYILPPIANSTSLALGLDLAGEALDEQTAELDGYTPLDELLPLVGGEHLDLPAGGNREGVTRLVVQHAEDGIEDGHEVVFQKPGPKEQVRAFLDGLAAGGPQVPAVEQR